MDSIDLVFKTLPNGTRIEATVSWSRSSSERARPIALAFHGGAFVIGSRSAIPPQQVAELVESEIIVVAPDYRLCPQVSLYDGPEQDAKDAYHWTKKTLPSLLAAQCVTADPTKIVALGYSAGGTLALCLGSEPDPPLALLDFYGAKYFEDSFWFSPLPALAGMPDFEDEFVDRVFEEPVKTYTKSMLEQRSSSETGDDDVKGGLPKPDLSVPRNAWLFTCLKRGTQIEKIVQDGDYHRVDPVNGFSESFPPTLFIHGTADTMVLPRFSEQAYQKLKDIGVEARLILVPEASHGFDMGLTRNSADYLYVKQGLDYLKSHV